MRSSLVKELSLALSLAAMGAAHAASLEDVLARMDSAAKEFKSYSANVKRVDYTKIIDDKAETTGSLKLQRAKNGIAGVMNFTSGPDSYVVALSGGTLKKYLPKANEVQVYNLKKSAGALDQFFLLGFASTREEMLADYAVKLVGTEKVGGIDTTHIVLTPKSTATLKLVKTVDLWIPEGKGYPVQQKGTEPSGNYYLATYSDMQVNPPLPPSAFEFSVPPGAKTVKEN
jgi:outer membrane lipoprotein-sorting protein